MSEKVLVIGGNAAGMSAASQLRRMKKETEIIVFEKGTHVSYSSCGIPYYVGDLVDNWHNMISRTKEEFEQNNIHVQLRHEVKKIDTAGKTLEVTDLESGKTVTEQWDKLLIATGSVPMRPPVPGIQADGVMGVDTLDSGILLKKWVEEHRPQNIVVIGGGYIGIEMAEAMNCHLGLNVSLVERGPQVMGTLDPDMGALVSEMLRKVGITLYLEESLLEIITVNGKATAVKTDKRTIPADLVILGLGVSPNTRLAIEAGLPTGVRNALVVDEQLRTPISDVWAAGDCVQSINLISGKPMYIALGTVANKQGRIAGFSMGGADVRFPGVLGTAACRICQYEVTRTGLMERELKELGIDYATGTIESETRAGYMPGAGEMTVKLLADRASHKLLGAQIVGTEGAAHRINTLAAAITAGMTLDNLVDMDLAYAPPFSPVWDPVQQAARYLQGVLRRA